MQPVLTFGLLLRPRLWTWEPGVEVAEPEVGAGVAADVVDEVEPARDDVEVALEVSAPGKKTRGGDEDSSLTSAPMAMALTGLYTGETVSTLSHSRTNAEVMWL